MADFIIALIVIALVGGALTYIIKEKKKGAKCIGCPSAHICSKKNNNDNSSCNCH